MVAVVLMCILDSKPGKSWLVEIVGQVFPYISIFGFVIFADAVGALALAIQAVCVLLLISVPCD
jgi:hypothetical protein